MISGVIQFTLHQMTKPFLIQFYCNNFIATMFAATQWVTRQKPKELIVAVPVSPRESVDKLSRVADRIIVIRCFSYDNDEHYERRTMMRVWFPSIYLKPLLSQKQLFLVLH